MNNRESGSGLAYGVVIGVWLASMSVVTAYAQETVAEDGKLEEIVVTAQKRTENLQDVPVSVQVIGSQMLQQENLNTLTDLTQLVPGVHVSDGTKANNLYVRGIGTTTNSGGNPTFDQAVAIFIDDIFNGRSRLSDQTFLDVDRIEILKGPQSTFFGNNAIAGALNIVTKKPGDALDASGRVLYGQFGQYALEGAIGGPLTDTFGARLAVERTGEHGWITNVDTGEVAPDQNNLAGRLTLLYKPIESLVATLKIEGSDDRLSGTASGSPPQWINCPAPEPFGTTQGGGFATCAQALAFKVPVGLDNNLAAGLPGQGETLSASQDVLTVKYDRWGQTFTSVSGFTSYHLRQALDAADLPVPTITALDTEKYRQFSQEFRVASSAGKTLEYLVGVYFQTDRLDYSHAVNVPLLNPLISNIPALSAHLPLELLQTFAQEEHIYSAFGSLDWNVTDRWKLNAGLRGTWVNKTGDGTSATGQGTQTYGGFATLPPTAAAIADSIIPTGAVSPTLSDHEWMPSARIQYQVIPSAMAYLSYGRGFKAGGFDGTNPTEPAETIRFGSETVNAYELGFKSKWLQDRLLVNVDVFRSDYSGLQQEQQVFNPVFNTYGPQVKNAGKSRSEGVEFEGQWAASRELRIAANVTYLNAYYVSFPNSSPLQLQVLCGTYTAAVFAATPQCAAFPYPVPNVADLSGQALPYSPRWSGSLNANYTVALPGDLQFTTELTPYFSAKYIQYDDPAYLGIPGYVRLDARLSIATSNGRWAMDVIGKNLTSRIIVDSSGFQLATKEEPRNVAVQFRYHFF